MKALLAMAMMTVSISAASAADGKDNESRIFRVFLGHAVHGDALAQFVVGHRYEFGRGIAPDRDRAVQWYRRAADGARDPDLRELARFRTMQLGAPLVRPPRFMLGTTTVGFSANPCSGSSARFLSTCR